MKSDQAKPTRLLKDIRIQVGSVIGFMIFILITWYWVNSDVQTTDNATVACDVIDVTSEVKGIVQSINFSDNQRVAQGQILANIDSRLYAANLRQSEAELEISKYGLSAAVEKQSLVALNSRSEFEQSIDSLAGLRARRMSIENEIAELKSSIAVARIEVDQKMKNFERIRILNEKQLISGSQYDDAKSDYEAAQARLVGVDAKFKAKEADLEITMSNIAESEKRSDLYEKSESKLVNQVVAEVEIARANTQVAQARRDLAALNMERTEIKALSPGVISDRNVGVGQLVEVGQPIARIVSCTEEAWIEANFKETQIGNMKPGQRVKFEIDAYPNRQFSGTVESISSATGTTFSLLPPENATGNFTKVVKRIPVKITPLDKPEEFLRAGMSAVVSVYEN